MATQTLTGKKVVLLGGSAGIGLATAKAAAAEGAHVVIVSGNQQRIDQALKELPAGSEGFAADLSKEASFKTVFEKVGQFDHLVYTAGENLRLYPVAETNIDDAKGFFTIRLWGAYTAVKYGTPHINKGGSINLMGGTAGARPGAGWSVASTICGAMEGMVRAFAVELAPVRVNSVVAGMIKTGLWDGIPQADREAMFTNVGNNLLVKRVGEAEDVALAFVYLMKQAFGTGQNIVVDGGTLLV